MNLFGSIKSISKVDSLTVISPVASGGIAVFPDWLVATCNMLSWRGVISVEDSLTVTGEMVRSLAVVLMNLFWIDVI